MKLYLLLVLVTSAGAAVEFVDILRGVSPNRNAFSYGNVLPLVAVPRGTARWGVSTDDDLFNAWWVTLNRLILQV